MRQQAGILCASILLFSAPVWAVDDGTKEAPPVDDSEGSVSYSTGGLARSSFDNIRLSNSSQLIIDNGVSLVANVGFRVPTFPVFGLELEIAATVIPGQVVEENCSVIGGGGFPFPDDGETQCSTSDRGDFGINNISVFGTFRSPGKFYGMAKYGIGYIQSNLEGYPEERNIKPYGFGVGYRWNPRKLSGVELYYSKAGDTVSYQGLSFSYGFGGRD